MASDIYRSWQDPSNQPVIWLTQTERDLYENMRNAARKLVEIAH